MTETAFERVLARFRDEGLIVDERGGKASAQAPGHSQKDRSVIITPSTDRVLIHSHSDPTDDVLDALHLSHADLYDNPRGSTYNYPDGRTVSRTPDKRFRQSGNRTGTALYMGGTAQNLPESGTVYVVEGEKDVDTITAAGAIAVTSAMGAGKSHLADWTPLSGRHVVIVADKDDPGRRYAQQVAEHLDGIATHVDVVEALTGKDASDHIAAGHELAELVPKGGSGTSSVPADQPIQTPAPQNIRPLPTQPVLVPVPGSGTGTTSPTANYYDMAALLAGDLPDPPAPSIMSRSDGVSIFYANAYNLVFSDAESGKTWLLLCAMAEELNKGHRVLFVDLDHNGPVSIATRLVDLGVSTDILSDLDRFRYIEPPDTVEVAAVIEDAAAWSPNLAVIDSLGELLPMYRASSNSDDDFTNVHSRIIKPLVRSGAAVVLIDHLAKGQESRATGPTGAAAKRRAVDGVSLRVTKKTDFVPGKGGTAYLAINKDRHGGLRANSRTDDREPLAAVFKLIPDGDGLRWELRTPNDDERAPVVNPNADLVAKIADLTPPPKSANDAHSRLGGNRTAVLAAFKEWQSTQLVPVPDPGTGTSTGCPICTYSMTAREDIAVGHHLACAEKLSA